MKALITNTINMNAGVGAMTSATIQLLRQEFGDDLEVIVYDVQADVAQRYYPHLNLRQLLYYRVSKLPRNRWLQRFFGPAIGSLHRARFVMAVKLWGRGKRRIASLLLTSQERIDVEQYESADLVVSSGGTYLVDNYDLSPKLFDLKITEMLGQPLVLFTQSVGPFTKPETQRSLQGIFQRARLLLLRDDESMQHVRKLGVDNPNIKLSPDSVFIMERGSMRARALGSNGERTKRAAISVRHWPYFQTQLSDAAMAHYRGAVAQAVIHLVRELDFDVVFLSTCQGIPEYWFNDSDVAHQIAAQLPEDVQARVSVDGQFRTPEQVIDCVAEFDLVIATRFHMAVLSLIAGVPTVGISYEFKTRELYAGLEIEDWMVQMEGITGSDLIRAVDTCVSASRDRLLKLADLLEEQRRAVAATGALMARAAGLNSVPRPHVKAVDAPWCAGAMGD